MTSNDLAKKFDVSTQTIRRWAADLGIGKKISDKDNAPFVFTDKEVKIFEQFHSGK
jgi:DNA-binding transcriptional MerR regulator